MTPMDADRLIAHERQATWIGRRIEYRESAGSTNDLCHERAGDSDLHGLVIVADHQYAGRGQHGRVWSAPPGTSLLFSILLFPDRELSMPHFLTAWAASTIAEAIRSLGLDARIKWPNDLLIDGKKVSGILVERRAATVVGVGVNVAIPPNAFPNDLRLPATSLTTELHQPVDRTDLFLDILARLDARYCEATQEGPRPIWRRWPALAENLVDEAVVATTHQATIRGKLIELRPDIGARIQSPNGSVAIVPPEQLLRVERCSTDDSH